MEGGGELGWMSEGSQSGHLTAEGLSLGSWT